MRIIYRILDIVLFFSLLLRFIFWSVGTYLDSNYFRRRRQVASRKMLDFTSASYAAREERELLFWLTQNEEGGYFDHVYTIHPFEPTSQTVQLSDRSTFIEYGTERYSRLKELEFKYTRGALILWDFFHLLVNLVRKENINIIRSNHPFINGLIVLICSKLTNTPSCVSIRADFDLTRTHGRRYYPTVLGSQRLARRVETFTLSHASRVIATNESRARYGIKHGANPGKIKLIPFEIDNSKFPQPNPTLKKELGIEGKKVISFVGRLVSYNYVADVIQIASKVCRQRKDAIFLIVGGGEERKSLEELTHNLGLDDSVRFLGMQVWQKAMQIRLISDVSLCLVAGNSLVEAAIAATPLVSYDVDWHYELVKNGETGFLLPEGDVDGVAEAIIRLVDDPELAKRMGQNARKLATERHSIEKVRQIKIDFYEELMRRAK